MLQGFKLYLELMLGGLVKPECKRVPMKGQEVINGVLAGLSGGPLKRAVIAESAATTFTSYNTPLVNGGSEECI